MSKKGDLGKIAAGAAIGVGLGVLLAPKKGSETRALLKEKISELGEKVKNLDSNNLKNEFTKKIKALEKDIKEFDCEETFSKAKEKAKDIIKRASELVDLAIEKGNKSLEKTANEIKEKAINVTDNVLAKLKKEA